MKLYGSGMRVTISSGRVCQVYPNCFSPRLPQPSFEENLVLFLSRSNTTVVSNLAIPRILDTYPDPTTAFCPPESCWLVHQSLRIHRLGSSTEKPQCRNMSRMLAGASELLELLPAPMGYFLNLFS
jgi:hypothetical protein